MSAALTTPATTDDQRWSAWKQAGAASELRRRSRMRAIFAAICAAGALWLLSGAL